MDADLPFPDNFWSDLAYAAVWGDWGEEGRGLLSFNSDAGELYSQWLTSYAKECKAEARTNSKVTELVIENGAVAGVKVEDPQKTYTVKVKKVILACGGMEANPELVKAYAPEAAGMGMLACPGNTGDFVALTEPLASNLVGYGSVAETGPERGRSSSSGVSVMVFSLMVDKDGRRFTQEGRHVLPQSQGH